MFDVPNDIALQIRLCRMCANMCSLLIVSVYVVLFYPSGYDFMFTKSFFVAVVAIFCFLLLFLLLLLLMMMLLTLLLSSSSLMACPSIIIFYIFFLVSFAFYFISFRINYCLG